MSELPERIWLTGFVKDEYGARLGRGTISDLDHGQNPDYPEYVRADRIEELEAKLHKAELKLEYATLELKAIEDEPNSDLAHLVIKTIAKFAISELENEDRWVDPKGKYK
jgi:hypothetical protein